MKQRLLVSLSGLAAVLLLWGCSTPRERNDVRAYLKLPPQFTVTHQTNYEYPDSSVKLLCTAEPGDCMLKCSDYKRRLMGQMMRVLRFQNITRVVERHYDLPDNVLLAMMMQESGGVNPLPNCRHDGGIGLCHMQGIVGKSFGLRTVCADTCPMACKTHGLRLRDTIEALNRNVSELAKIDDRFNPLLNLDAAGRILAYYMDNPIITKYGFSGFESALRGYTGGPNFKQYYKNLKIYLSKLNDDNFINDTRKAFNELNDYEPQSTDTSDLNFDRYVMDYQKSNYNYGLADYERVCGYSRSKFTARTEITYYYRIKAGDILGRVARCYRTTPEAVAELNPDRITKANGYKIIAGTEIIIERYRLP